jgi:hypothetical protein
VSGNLASGLLSSDRATTIHEIAPLVDGIGRSTIVWGEVDAIAHPQVTGDEAMALRAMRFDGGPLSATPDVLPSQELVAHSQRTERALSLAYDSTTRSHWALATRDLTTDSLRLRVAGMTGRQLRNELLHGGSINARGAVADVVYDAENRRFPIAYRTFGSPSQILGTFELHPDHPVTTYGTPACSTAQSSVTRDFLRGNEFATVALQNASASMPAALFVSAAPRSQSLSALGMTGCSLLVDLDALVCNLPGNTSANGAAYRTIALPETLSTMDVYAQWAFFAPGANPLGVVTTSGLHIRIR